VKQRRQRLKQHLLCAGKSLRARLPERLYHDAAPCKRF
jgi:hypothetical protein